MSKLVSIVMSNHNGEAFLRDTIESVLNQTYADFEYLIVDDCSTDHSREIMDSYDDQRIVRLYLDHHEHMVYGFNYAISASHGDYIARIDSDDTYQPEKLARQVEYMDAHPECGACFTLVNVINEENRVLSGEETDRVAIFNTANRSQAEWLRQFYFNGSCLCHTSAMMRADALKKVGVYNIALRQIQDYELWLRIAKKYPIHVVQERLVNYRWMTSGANASAVTPAVLRRSNFEFGYVLSHYFDDIPDEMFIRAFGDDFIHKGTTDHLELLCERALMLLKTVFYGNNHKIGGMEKLIDLLNHERTRLILREKYGVTQLNFYDLAASPVFYEEPGAQPPAPAANAESMGRLPGKITQKLKSLVKNL